MNTRKCYAFKKKKKKMGKFDGLKIFGVEYKTIHSIGFYGDMVYVVANDYNEAEQKAISHLVMINSDNPVIDRHGDINPNLLEPTQPMVRIVGIKMLSDKII